MTPDWFLSYGIILRMVAVGPTVCVEFRQSQELKPEKNLLFSPLTVQ
jgi:hypothetical protein